MTDLKQNPAAQVPDRQDRPGQGGAVRIPLIEAIEYCRSSDLPEVFGEVDLELQMVRLGQGRWKEMRLDLMCGQASCVRPIDYCVEISPEEAAYLKENEGIDLNQLLSARTLHRFAKMLELRGFELMREYTLEDVLHILDDFEVRMRYLTRIHDALRRAVRTEAQAYRAAQQTDMSEPQTKAPPVSRKKPRSRKSAERASALNSRVPSVPVGTPPLSDWLCCFSPCGARIESQRIAAGRHEAALVEIPE